MSGGVFSCSVHTHSALCDGRGSLANMAEAAFAAGIKHFGFSGHIHTPIPHDEGNVLPSGAEEYLDECHRLKQLYGGSMEVLMGIEWDSMSDEKLPEGLDYWIGSVHNLGDPLRGEYYSVDWHKESLFACRDRLFGGDIYALCAAYYAEVTRVAAMKPTILGHFDLVTKLNGDGGIFDEKEPEYLKSALAALERVDPKASVMEVNTGAVARGYRKDSYPADFILRAWREMGGRVIITSDAHSPENLLFGYESAAARVKAAGYGSCALLTGRGIIDCEI